MGTQTLSSSSSWIRWAQLIRLPATFTIIADVSAAFLLVAGTAEPWPRFVVVVLAGILLYSAGMVLNDVFDVEKDRVERPKRPLPAGDISVAAASRAGWGLLLGGVVLAGISGLIPAEGYVASWRPAAVAVVLAAMIVAYDGPLKRTVVAPLLMGGCRVLSFLLGASAAIAGPVVDLAGFAPPHVWAFAAGMGVYIMGVTTMARHEADTDEQRRGATLPVGLVVAMGGAVLLALAPTQAVGDPRWFISPDRGFPLLIGLIALSVLSRGVRAIFDPQPWSVPLLIRSAVLTVIPFSAAIALLAAGPAWALAIFVLVVPAMILGARLRVS